MRNQALALSILLSAALTVVPPLAHGEPGNGNVSQSEFQRGYAFAPVELNLTERNFGLVGLGAYLVNGPLDCAGCHTAGLYLPGGDPFLGQPMVINKDAYLGGGGVFGPLISRDLAPNKDSLPAGLTFDQFNQLLRMGTDFKSIPPYVPSNPGLLQVRPGRRTAIPLTRLSGPFASTCAPFLALRAVRGRRLGAAARRAGKSSQHTLTAGLRGVDGAAEKYRRFRAATDEATIALPTLGRQHTRPAWARQPRGPGSAPRRFAIPQW